MPSPYDLIAIGSGTAAQGVIARVHDAGWRVAVIDHRPLGGTCALRGCDPKKMLVSGEETIHAVERMRDRGVTGSVAIDWAKLIAFKRTFTDPIPDKQQHSYARRGIDTFRSLARFASPDTVRVEGRELQARHILIATGARPARLHIPGEELVITSDVFMELQNLPPRIVLIGGGYIAAELRSSAAK